MVQVQGETKDTVDRIESLNNVLRHMCPFTYHIGGTAVGNSLFRKRFWVNWIPM